MTAADARGLLRRARSAALATTLADGMPYASLITVACDLDAGPILLLSDLSDHTRNLGRDPRASILVEAASRRRNPQTGPRVSLLGRIAPDAAPRLRRRFLARHPDAALYADFGDFHIYKMTVERAHMVAGFGRAAWFEAADILADTGGTVALGEDEPDIVTRINANEAPLLDRVAARLGHSGNGWTIVAVDGEGCDLRRAGILARVDLPPVCGGGDVVRHLGAVADGI